MFEEIQMIEERQVELLQSQQTSASTPNNVSLNLNKLFNIPFIHQSVLKLVEEEVEFF